MHGPGIRARRCRNLLQYDVTPPRSSLRTQGLLPRARTTPVEIGGTDGRDYLSEHPRTSADATHGPPRVCADGGDDSLLNQGVAAFESPRSTFSRNPAIGPHLGGEIGVRYTRVISNVLRGTAVPPLHVLYSRHIRPLAHLWRLMVASG